MLEDAIDVTPTVYVAGPYSNAPQENTERAIEKGNAVRELGFVPYIPHLSHFWDERFEHDYQYWLNNCYHFVNRVDHFLRFEGDSPGAENEIKLAEHLDMKVHYGVDDFRKSVIEDGTIVCVIGPSGIGKSTMVDFACETTDRLVEVVSYTSRDKRGDEEHGVDYHFVSEEVMLAKADNSNFVEFVEYSGNYYGLLEREFLSALEKTLVPIAIVTREGYEEIKSHFEETYGTDVVSVGLHPSVSEPNEQFRAIAENRGREGTFEDEISDALACDHSIPNIYSTKNYTEMLCRDVFVNSIIKENIVNDMNYAVPMIDKEVQKNGAEFHFKDVQPDLHAAQW